MEHTGSENWVGGNSDGSRCALAGSLEPINLFSLVGYIPGTLGDFLTSLREDLVTGCVARAHVTVLPPRPLEVHPGEAEKYLRERLPDFSAFEVHMPRLACFEDTHVVYAEVGCGSDQLVRMHQELNSGPFSFDELYPFHPHVTLAQGLPSETLAEVFEHARGRWLQAPVPRSFLVESLVFVQNTAQNRWMDLASYNLDTRVSVTCP